MEDRLFELHEDRIGRVEGLLTQILPTLARMEEKLDRLPALEDKVDRLSEGLEEVKISAATDTARDQQRDAEIVELKEHRSTLKTRVLGAFSGVALVLLAATLAFLGLK